MLIVYVVVAVVVVVGEGKQRSFSKRSRERLSACCGCCTAALYRGLHQLSSSSSLARPVAHPSLSIPSTSHSSLS